MRTREFAAIPLVDRKVLGVLTLVNRAHPGDAARPFSLAELRRAETRAGDIAKALALLPGLKTGGADADLLESLGADLVADLEQLDARERGIAHSLVTALLQNRAQ
jgi:hypothetical protein